MNPGVGKYSDNNGAQPLRELEWLANYFKEHCREDLAEDIFQKIVVLRHKAQDSLTTDEASNVVDFGEHTKDHTQDDSV